MAAGVPAGHRPELQAGGLIRSRGWWRVVTAARAVKLLACVWVEVLDRRASTPARAYGQTRGNVSLAALARGPPGRPMAGRDLVILIL